MEEVNTPSAKGKRILPQRDEKYAFPQGRRIPTDAPPLDCTWARAVNDSAPDGTRGPRSASFSLSSSVSPVLSPLTQKKRRASARYSGEGGARRSGRSRPGNSGGAAFDHHAGQGGRGEWDGS